MITAKRKGKHKHLVEFTPAQIDTEHDDIRTWCTEMFGPGGRNTKCRWRYGWTTNTNTYHFKHGEDVTAFMLRWS